MTTKGWTTIIPLTAILFLLLATTVCLDSKGPSEEEVKKMYEQATAMEAAEKREDDENERRRVYGIDEEEERDPTELHKPSTDVLRLTEANFVKKVIKPTSITLVEFGAPKIVASLNFAPIIDVLATNLKGVITVASVNCEKEFEICRYFAVGPQHMPTLMLFPGAPTQDPKGHGYIGPGPFSGKDPIPYQEASWDPERIAEWAFSYLNTDNILRVTWKNKDEFHRIKELPKLYWFAENDHKPSNLLMALSMQYERRMLFGLVKRSETLVQEKFGIKEFPALMILDRSWEMRHYRGKPASAAIARWISKYSMREPIKELNIPFFRNYAYKDFKDEL